MQCKDIPDRPILEFLKRHIGQWCTHGIGYSMPTIADAMPDHTPKKLQMAKMGQLIKRGLISGCACGCRGDYEITQKGIEYLEGGNNGTTKLSFRAERDKLERLVGRSLEDI